MANLTTNADLIANILDRAGEPTDGTSDYATQALDLYNRAYRTLCNGGGEFAPEQSPKWWWLRARATLVLLPAYETGTASVTADSTSVTLGTPPSDDLTGWHFKVIGHDDVFKITAWSTPTATLDLAYTGDTNAAAEFRVFKIDYNIANSFLWLTSPMQVYQDDEKFIYMVDEEKLNRDFPLSKIKSGVPTRFAPLDSDDFRFNSYIRADGNKVRVDYTYLAEPAALADDANAPLVPLEYRHILTDMALAYLWQQKNDNRANGAAESAQAGIRAMANVNSARWRINKRSNLVLPRQRGLHTRILRTESGRIIG